MTFFALAAYLVAESIHDLVSHARPGQSVAGLAVTASALLVMPGLAIAKRRTGQALGSRTLIADSAETAFCAFTSASALIGLGLNASLGWWWADPAAALVIAAWQSRKASKPGNTTTEDARPFEVPANTAAGPSNGVGWWTKTRARQRSPQELPRITASRK